MHECFACMQMLTNVNPIFACWIPWNWVTDDCNPPQRCWELNWISCKRIEGLAAEPSVQSLKGGLFKITISDDCFRQGLTL